MKSPACYLVLKIVSLILATLFFVCALLSAIGIAVMVNFDGYRLSYDRLSYEFIENRYRYLTWDVADRFNESLKNNADFSQTLKSVRAEIPFTAFFSVYDRNEKLLYSDYEGEEYDFLFEDVAEIGGTWVSVSSPNSSENSIYADSDSQYTSWIPNRYRVVVRGVNLGLTGNQRTEFAFLRFFHTFRISFIPILCVSVVAFFALFAFLMVSAGRKTKGSEVKAGKQDRILFECYLVLMLLILVVQCYFLGVAPNLLWFVSLSLGIFGVIDCIIVLLILMSLAVRIKTGIFFATTAWRYLLRWGQKGKRVVLSFWENCRLVPKIVLVLSATALFDFFLATFLDYTEFLAAVFIEGLVLSGILVWYGASLHKLGEDQKRLADGHLDYRCDPSRMPPGLRSLGENLNCTAEGMERAVEEKMKSERFKTELITNVSHDIKTPLTSIVNYVDLMKKENIENETVREYLEVLDRQSIRLKKLTEDLVESSKAASGVLPVHLSPLDLKVFLEQTLGEYQANLEEKALEPLLDLPDSPLFVMADGKLLWRVVDNLMNNISKYALSGTRVYLTAQESGERAILAFRNISANALKRSGEELTERFVQGDLSRTGEGSGLGLAIAKSLTELQRGEFRITVDGDLFKVELMFDRVL